MLRKVISAFTLKDVIYLSLIMLLAVFLLRNMRTTNEDRAVAFSRLPEQVVRSSTDIVTKIELTPWGERLGDSFTVITKDLSGIHAALRAVGKTTILLPSARQDNLPSTSQPVHLPPVQPPACALCDLYSYTLAVQSIDVLGVGGVPIANVSFDASLRNPWAIKTEDLEITVNTVVGERGGGGLIFYHTASVNNKVRGTKKDLSITTSEYKQALKSKEFFWWAPVIDLNLVAGVSLSTLDLATCGEIGFSMMGYGKDKDTLDWRFLHVGAGAGTGWFLTFAPGKYNIARHLPLLTNIWIGVDGLWQINEGVFGLGFSFGARL